MTHVQSSIPNLTIGVDLGDRLSRVAQVDAAGTEVRSEAIATTPQAVRKYFEAIPCARVVMEAGTHSPWVSREIAALGHEVVVGNPSEMYAKVGRRGKRRRCKKRNDKLDASFLARQGRADVSLLYPIRHRSAKSQADLELLRGRDQLVQVRTKLVNHVRGAVKSYGYRVVRSSTPAFPRRVLETIPEALRPALEPVTQVIADLTKRIDAFDEMLQQRINEEYPQAKQVQQIKGVGPITALAFVLLVDDPKRFSDSRDVGAYFGLVPQLDESSDSEPQLGITKAGDELGRRLLVSAAHYILGPFGPECDLRRHGLAICARGGPNAKKRAAVAVARKLAVLMHRLWVDNTAYQPDRQAKRQRPA
jgi:transposase